MVDFGNLVNQTAALFGVDNSRGVQEAQQGTSLAIEEVTGDLSVVLRGRSMPYRGVEWGVEQRIKTDWYPGNPVASQQILGPQEGKTVLKGMWKDRFIRGSIEVSGADTPRFATDAVQLFHRICRAGRLLRVSYLAEVRVGYLRKFVPTYDRAQDVAWEMEFEWQGREDQVFVREEEAPSSPRTGFDLFSALQDAVAAVAAVVSLANAWVAGIVSAINEIGDSIAGLTRLLEVAATLTSLPSTLIGAITAQVAAIVRQVTSLLRQILSPRGTVTPVAQLVAKPAISPTSRKASAAGSGSRRGQAPPASAVANTTRFERARRAVGRAASNIAAYAQTEEARILARVSPATTVVVTVSEQQSLYSLSTKYYGSPDYAGYIAAVNRLGSGNVAAGTQIRIPPRPVGTTLPKPGSSTLGGVCRA